MPQSHSHIMVQFHSQIMCYRETGSHYEVVSSQTSPGAYITSSITRKILKAIRTGVGFGSGTETNDEETNLVIPADSKESCLSSIADEGVATITHIITNASGM